MTSMSEAVYQGRRPMKGRSIALLSVFGVIGGTALMFRFLAPQPGTLNTSKEVATYRGAESEQTDQGDKFRRTAHPPRKEYPLSRPKF
ncbi:uncharacterized protein N7518_002584 [Penicillium psychrosexuale]|uniref:uncharacterized protein n=1 Tax=Penicillium psychrosexuale TaxID=1002107 RepID=UPI002544F655|nr:uncharacterized protein N7518_002584 [Penicillium psychrosexuale]KAJ5800516.1 hypothetical protein N7518_002584 [Penicillium psychrosexuale]